MSSVALGSFTDLFDQLFDQSLAMRIAIAQHRDEMLTHAELIAILEVYGEFGR